jgi:hypothetical protein
MLVQPGVKVDWNGAKKLMNQTRPDLITQLSNFDLEGVAWKTVQRCRKACPCHNLWIVTCAIACH